MGSSRCRAADWCPIFVRRCTIGVNAKLPWCLSLFKIRFSSDAPRNEFAGGERGDNRGTKCPAPKRCWTESNSAFSFACTDFHRWCIGLRNCRIPRLHSHRASSALRRVPRFPFPAIRSQTARCHARAVRAYPVGVREMRPLHLAFADRAVGKIGRQFSYKQNAEEGARLDEQRSTMDRGRKGGWRRSFVIGCASVLPGLPEPSCGRYARCGTGCRHRAFAGRCARTRLRMNRRFSDLSPPARVAGPSQAGAPSGDRCARIDRLHDPAFLRLLHPDDIAAAHRGGRTNVSAAIHVHANAHAPRRRDPAAGGVSRENERRRGKTR